jgi:dihydrofolate synthase/folylpolyglutamate synthase
MKYVHIAGTNGKGSAAEYIYQIISAAGETCGLFTSPHLVSPTERFRANGEQISAAELDALLCEAEQKKLAVNDSLFAAYTAAALLWFERLDLRYAVLETGLGGRLDPTNVITPEISVLTAIGCDHLGVLGDTIEKIASEKAGIIKPGVPVVSARQLPEAERVIRETCHQKGCALYFVDDVKVLDAALSGQTFESCGRRYHIRGIGEAQPEIAALAALAAREMGFSEETIREGLARAVLPCRTQFISGMPDMLLDGAHNGPAVAALCRTLDRHFAGREKVLLFACMKDKDFEDMAAQLAPRFDRAFVTSVDPVRGAPMAALAELFGLHNACAVDEPRQACETAAKAARESGGMLVVCGSFYLTGLVLHIMGESPD